MLKLIMNSHVFVIVTSTDCRAVEEPKAADSLHGYEILVMLEIGFYVQVLDVHMGMRIII